MISNMFFGISPIAVKGKFVVCGFRSHGNRAIILSHPTHWVRQLSSVSPKDTSWQCIKLLLKADNEEIAKNFFEVSYIISIEYVSS